MAFVQRVASLLTSRVYRNSMREEHKLVCEKRRERDEIGSRESWTNRLLVRDTYYHAL